MTWVVLLSLTKRQIRREESDLIIPNKRRATPYSAWLDSIRRARSIVLLCGVIARICSMTARRSLHVAGQQNGLWQDDSGH